MQQFPYVEASKAVGGGHTGATSSGASPAYPGSLWSPSMNERDIIFEAMAELPDIDGSSPAQWPGPPDSDY